MQMLDNFKEKSETNWKSSYAREIQPLINAYKIKIRKSKRLIWARAEFKTLQVVNCGINNLVIGIKSKKMCFLNSNFTSFCEFLEIFQ